LAVNARISSHKIVFLEINRPHVQSFTLWQQATIEVMRRDHSSRTLVITFNVFIQTSCYWCSFQIRFITMLPSLCYFRSKNKTTQKTIYKAVRS